MSPPWRITVLAGPDGAGKSSLAGAALRREGTDYWNCDEIARLVQEQHPSMEPEQARATAWLRGTAHLEDAIAARRSFVLETTLGGDTVPRILRHGIAEGAPVHLWYVGLEGVELHLERVRARAARGGHGVPEDRLREEHRASRENLLALMPGVERLSLYDNTAGPAPDGTVTPRHLLTMEHGRIVGGSTPLEIPTWAKPAVMRAIGLHGPAG